MKILRLRPAHRDARGAILDILAGIDVDAVTHITSKKGAVRGNHYHKKTIQYAYVLSGCLRFLTVDRKGRKRQRLLRPGDLIENPSGEPHTFVALEDSSFLALSRGPRKGVDFEKDTYRLARPLA